MIKYSGGLPRGLLWMLSVVLVLLALLVSLGRQLLPLVADYRTEVAAQVQAVLNVPVEIGQLDGQWKGFSPRLIVHDVQLGTAQGRVRLGYLEAELDLWESLKNKTLLLGKLSFRELNLGLVEDQAGTWTVKGLPSTSETEETAVSVEQILEALQHVRHIGLYDSQLSIQAFGEPEHRLTHIELALADENGALRLDGRAQIVENIPLLTFSIRLQADPATWQEQGHFSAYLNVPTYDWAAWLPKRLMGAWHVKQAQMGTELWLEGQGLQLEQAAVRLTAPLLKLNYGAREPVTVTGLDTTIHMQHRAEGYQLLAERLTFVHDKHPPTTLQFNMEQHASAVGPELLWHIGLDTLDVAALTVLMQRLMPLSSTQQELLKDLNPNGQVQNLGVTYDPNIQGAQQLRYAANLDKVSFSSHEWIPAAGNVTGSISGDLAQGELRFDSDRFSLHLSELFPEPWRYQHAGGRLAWTIDDQAVTLIAPFLQLRGEEGEIVGDFLIRLYDDPKAESYMDLRVGLHNGDSRFTGRYLPTRSPALSADLVEWLNTAIRGGHIEQGYFQYQGSLNSDSPANASALDLYFKISDIELDYQKGWPRIQGGRGEVIVEGTGTRVYLSEGRILNSRVHDVTAMVPSVPDNQPLHLFIKGLVQGQVADGLDILRAAPLDAEEVFNTWQGDGQLNAQLDLDIPLAAKLEPRVVVDFSTQGATLVISQPDLRLEQLSGKFRYESDKGVSASSMEARLLGGKVKARLIEAGHAGEPLGRIEAWGDISVERLGQWLGLEQKLPVSGQLPFQLSLSLADQDSQLRVSSSLLGTQIDLPAPFGKSAKVARDASLRMTLHGRERRYWVQYADLASLSFAAPPDKLNKGRGELRLGTGPARLPATSGLQVQGTIATLDVNEWQQWLNRAGLSTNSGASKRKNDDTFDPDWLSSVQIHIGRFTGFGLTIPNLDTRLMRQSKGWQLGVDSDVIAGQVVYATAGDVPLDIRLQRVRLPDDNISQVSQSADDPLADLDPRDIPSMNVSVQEVWYGAESFGSGNLKLRSVNGGLTFTDVSVNLKGLKVSGSGGWKSGRSWYQGRLQGDDMADVLKAWGFAPTVTSEHFRVDIDGNWPGSPAALDARHFSGLLTPRFRRGQFIEMDPQALRVFGLLNFNAIGRRLRLDFSDLIGKGLSYDEVRGQLVAANGVYTTRDPLTLAGPSTNVELNGMLDLAHDRIDARLLVTLPVTNNLPLAAVIAGAPAVGGALWAVDKILGRHVAQLATVQYRVKGPWQSPDISFDKPFEKPRF